MSLEATSSGCVHMGVVAMRFFEDSYCKRVGVVVLQGAPAALSSV